MENPVTGNRCTYACRIGSLELLKSAHEGGEEIEDSSVKRAIKGKHYACFNYIVSVYKGDITRLCPFMYDIIFEREDGVCLSILSDHGVELDEYGRRMASIQSFPTPIMKKLREAGVEFTKFAIEDAARHDLERVICLREMGYEWTESVCTTAARHGKVDILRYAHENGCPWDLYVYIYAIKGRNLDCFLYAIENDCPWDEWYFTQNGCLYWVRGCPTLERYLYALESGAAVPIKLILEDIRSNGFA